MTVLLDIAALLALTLVLTFVPLMGHRTDVRITREIRAAGISQPHIIMLTARVHSSDREEALRAGVDEVVAKPFRPREIVAHVKELLAAVA